MQTQMKTDISLKTKTEKKTLSFGVITYQKLFRFSDGVEAGWGAYSNETMNKKRL